MPPKARFTRKEIIKKAIDLAKREGMEGLTARELGKELESSARPIFTVFESMNEVKDAVRAYAKDTYLQYTGMGLKQENALEGYCMAHIIFAMKEPKLFDILFLGDTTKKTNALMMQGEECYIQLLENLKNAYHIEEAKAKRLYEHAWVYSHGIAVLCAENRCEFSAENINSMMREAYKGFLHELKK